jgi:uncharacterized membrane protein (UPF0127 family)
VIDSRMTMLAILTVFATGLFGFSCGAPLPMVSLTLAGEELLVEVASTPETRACGLSQREALAPDRGMLFVFPEPTPRAFWMKDTHMPLSIAFLDAHRAVLNTLDMTPLQTEERYPSAGDAAYALEVNQGWFEAHGVAVGDVAEFALPRVLRVQ